MGRRTLVVAMLIVVVVVTGTSAVAQDQGVDVRDNEFAPSSATVTVGDTVTWTQSGSNPHSVTAEDGSFDSGPNCPPACMGPGDTFSETFTEPGEYGYYCKIHGSPGQGMSGTVVVEAAAQQPDDEPAPDEPADDTNDEADAEQDTADAAAQDDALPHTGGRSLLALLGLALFVTGAFVFGRRPTG